MTLNPIEISIFQNLFQSVAEEMGAGLMRAAFSPNIKERRDHSCAVFDGDGAMIAQAAHIPVHLGSMPMSVNAVIKQVSLKPGELAIVNDPYQGGTHLPDITLVSAVFDKKSFAPNQPVFYLASRAHHADVGGLSPGSLSLARHIDEEGFRIPPSKLTDSLIEAFCRASRTPEERKGDLAAQTAANLLGVRRLNAMITEYGSEKLLTISSGLQDYASQIMGTVIDEIPDGLYQATDWMDSDGFEEKNIPIEVSIQIEGKRCTVDFSATPDQVEGPINAVRAITLSGVYYTMRCLAPPDMPSNQGCMAPVQVITRPGSLVDAREPAAVAIGNVETSQRIVDVLFKALAQALPGRIPAASSGTMSNVCIGSHKNDSPFVYYETLGGGTGAGAGWSGASAIHSHMTNTLNTPIEAFEHAYPMLITHYGVRPGSGGSGAHCGGCGLIREYEFREPVQVTVLCERQARGPYGLNGGQAGKGGETYLVTTSGERTRLEGKVTLLCEAGQRIRIETPGGGGFGKPG